VGTRTFLEGPARTFRADGFTLRYWEIGSGIPLLFLHGAGLPAWTFREIIISLARRHTVVVPEIPGFGRSDFPEAQWDFSTYASHIRKLLDAREFGIRRIVGYSFGGGIALHLAPVLPELESLVLLSPAEEGTAYRSAGVIVRIVREALGGLRESARTGASHIFARVARDYILNSFRWGFFQLRLLRVIVRCFRRAGLHGAVHARTTVLTADSDIFFPGSGSRLRNLRPDAVRRTLRGIHLWVLLDPARVEREIDRAFGE
jgi:pimeloyl-ACP methyl ester carboxylesterase